MNKITSSIKQWISFLYFTKYEGRCFIEGNENQKKYNFAVLLDEYGGMTGIVTLHDIIETLLGEIQEDDDIDEPDPIQQIDADQFRIYGQADIEDVEKA